VCNNSKSHQNFNDSIHKGKSCQVLAAASIVKTIHSYNILNKTTCPSYKNKFYLSFFQIFLKKSDMQWFQTKIVWQEFKRGYVVLWACSLLALLHLYNDACQAMVYGLIYALHEKTTISGYVVDPATRWVICRGIVPVCPQKSLSKWAIYFGIQERPAEKLPQAPVEYPIHIRYCCIYSSNDNE